MFYIDVSYIFPIRKDLLLLQLLLRHLLLSDTKTSQWALAAVFQLVAALSHKLKGCGFDSQLSKCLDCGFSPQSGQDLYERHSIDVSLPFSLPPFLSP